MLVTVENRPNTCPECSGHLKQRKGKVDEASAYFYRCVECPFEKSVVPGVAEWNRDETVFEVTGGRI